MRTSTHNKTYYLDLDELEFTPSNIQIVLKEEIEK